MLHGIAGDEKAKDGLAPIEPRDRLALRARYTSPAVREDKRPLYDLYISYSVRDLPAAKVAEIVEGLIAEWHKLSALKPRICFDQSIPLGSVWAEALDDTGSLLANPP